MTDLLDRAPGSAAEHTPEIGTHFDARQGVGRLLTRFALVGFVVGALAGG